MKGLLKLVLALTCVTAVTVGLLLASGYDLRELTHIGQPRNVLDVDGRTVEIPFAEGPAERRLPEVTATTTGAYTFITEDDGIPVRYDPCRPVPWVLAPAGMPAFAEPEVMAAVTDIQSRTGLEFVYEGTTDEVATFDRPLIDERYGERYAPLIIGWSDATATPDLAGTVSGVGGSTALPGAYGDQRYLRSGAVILDAADLSNYLASTGGALQVRAIIMHEIAHVLGLGHVEDASQLMYGVNDRQQTWGEGDLAGLAVAGAGPCE